MPSDSPVKLLPGTIRWRDAAGGQWLRAHFPTPSSGTVASTSFEHQFPLWRSYGMLTKKNGYRRPRTQFGAPHTDASIQACAERPGPIIMTTLAMVAGMLPAALRHRIGVEFRAPMAVAAISGLMVSTVLMRPSYDCELATRPTLHRAPG
ncbi:efflux RND transporter permease subunit [Rhizobium sp. YAF28]|uniref:efflux RND transporter permease subunit n=1 Tax=Rhizobium sp. YAF28 TaxID=3233081 RepID=UPI003F9B78CE